MGLMDKFKNLFTEEVEEEERPIKEVIKVEIPSPASFDEAKDNSVSENEFIRKEEKAKGPVYFDDKDFDTLEKPKEKVSTLKDAYNNGLKPIKKEEKPVFQLSPIISPVYGVLDKNYHKEDIMNKKTSLDDLYHTGKVMSIDDVRKKAFGTLEDDLESGMFSKNSILFNEEIEETEKPSEKDIFDELDFNLDGILDTPEEVKEEKKPLDLDYIMNTNFKAKKEETPKREIKLDYVMESDMEPIEVKEEKPVEKNLIEDELTKLVEENDLGEDDLFNLIDSMYEKREDE